MEGEAGPKEHFAFMRLTTRPLRRFVLNSVRVVFTPEKVIVLFARPPPSPVEIREAEFVLFR